MRRHSTELSAGFTRVYIAVNTLEPAIVILAQEGRKAYTQRFDIVLIREAESANEIWQADHKELDVTVLGPDGNPCRPWLTAIIDDFSRAVPGYYIGIEAPSILRTALAFRQAIWKKSDPQWLVCGIPDEFYVDHGSDFTSRHIEQVSADLKVGLSFSLVGEPRGRGKIERFFR
ncbi:MAG: transposase family protein, partial [Candidatus Obscuribacterales bacterium]|nr:transposase family protein [Candidatus Obscuribacterales bacterium]